MNFGKCADVDGFLKLGHNQVITLLATLFQLHSLTHIEMPSNFIYLIHIP